jgi:hypothetical protein
MENKRGGVKKRLFLGYKKMRRLTGICRRGSPAPARRALAPLPASSPSWPPRPLAGRVRVSLWEMGTGLAAPGVRIKGTNASGVLEAEPKPAAPGRCSGRWDGGIGLERRRR